MVFGSTINSEDTLFQKVTSLFNEKLLVKIEERDFNIYNLGKEQKFAVLLEFASFITKYPVSKKKRNLNNLEEILDQSQNSIFDVNFKGSENKNYFEGFGWCDFHGSFVETCCSVNLFYFADNCQWLDFKYPDNCIVVSTDLVMIV